MHHHPDGFFRAARTLQLRQLRSIVAAAGAIVALAGPLWAQDDRPALREAGDLRTVRLTPAWYGAARGIEVVHAIDYGSFVLLEITPDSYAQLQSLGIEFTPLRSATTLELQDDTIDTRSVSLTTLSTPGIWGDGFHLIQLLGPSKDEWRAALEASGLVFIQYFEPYAYLVRAWPEQIEAAEKLPFVRWVGPYLPDYKLPGDLLTRSGTIENVSVTIYDDRPFRDTVGATIEAVKRLGGSLVEEEAPRASDPFITALFTLPATRLRAVAGLGEVAWLSFRAPVDALEDEMSDQIIAGNFAPLIPGFVAWRAGVGVTGNGVIIAAIDSGYDTGVDATCHPDLSGRTIMLDTPDDTDGHGTHVGGIMAGNATLGTMDSSGFLMGLGVAPQSTLVVRLNSGAHESRTKDAVLNGAMASNHSYRLHDPGLGYTDIDRLHDMLVRDANQDTVAVAEPLVIVMSCGNSGSAGLTKEAKNIIAVGNTFNQRDGTGNPDSVSIDVVSSTSSKGPAGDGRVYPHVAAPGTNILSTHSSLGTASCTFITTGAGAPAADPTYSLCSGTSMAAPHVTGSVALIAEWWRTFNGGADPSPAMSKALLVNGAVDMGTADIPNGSEGWGRIDLSSVINTGLPTLYADQTTVFSDTGQTFIRTFSAPAVSQPVRVTLAWSDAPGPGTGGNPLALVNDLDLVIDDSGTAFLGNDFANGLSTTGGTADTIDNLENVFLQNPGATNFITVTVMATAINDDGVPYNGDATDQDFALVASNAVPNVSPPTALCQDVTVPAGATTCTADASIDDGSFDPDGDPVALSQDPPGPYGLGDTAVTLTATDDKGALDTCQATVTVVDVTPPAISCPADTTIECDESTDPASTGTATATDACDPTPTIDFTDNVVPTVCPADPIQEIIERTWTATDDSLNESSCPQEITVLKQVEFLDIKPGSCPNAHNLTSQGVLPVSLLGSDTFDVSVVDPATLLISRADCVGGAVAPVMITVSDTATPFAGLSCDCHKLTGDGILDLSLHFDRQALNSALGLDAFVHGDTIKLVLSGSLGGDCEFIASDCITIR